ncbi:MAG TPA: NADPH:quinone reductase [Pyrinomonadaceae bacterium]|jgi:NADPH2:quinone reductase
MKAIVVREFGAPEVMKLEEVKTPEVGAAQILVRVKAAGINPVDTYIRGGNYAQRPPLPYTPGKDAAGVVEAVGAGVENIKVGDRIYTADSVTGTYAEFALCEANQVHKLPENVSFEQGAGVFVPYATSFRALFQKAKGKSGETILVHGASGGVGIASVQWAKNAGLKVIGTAGSEDGKQLAKEQGADYVLDHSDENYLAEIKEITGGKGVDIILEMLANVNLQKDFEILAMFGRVTIIGNRGSLEFNPRAVMGRDAVVYGMALFNAPEAEMREIQNAIYEGLSKGFLNPVVGKTFPLREAAAAHHAVIEEKAFGKTILVSDK